MAHSHASKAQIVEIVNQLGNGRIGSKLAQALIEGRVEIVDPKVPTPSYADLKKAFDWVNSSYETAIFKRIDVCKDVSLETEHFELVHLDKDASTETVLAELKEHKLRPAMFEELLAFAAKNPDEQKKYPIVALGSVCLDGGDLFSPCVCWDDGGRDLHLDWVGCGWVGDCRFLAVRQP